MTAAAVAALPSDRGHDHDVRRHLALIVATMRRSVSSVALGVRDVVARRLPEVEGDPMVRDLVLAGMRASAHDLIREIDTVVAGEDRPPPAEVIECTRVLAQRGVPVHAWVRAYAAGQQRLLRWALDAALGVNGTAHVRTETYEWILDEVLTHHDRISGQIVEVYEDERAAWLAGQSQTQADRVREVLADAQIDERAAQRLLGCPVSGHHVGIVASTRGAATQPDRLRRFSRAIRQFAHAIGGRSPLIVSCDRNTAWAWVPVHAEWRFDSRLADWEPSEGPSMLLTIGSAQRGLDGFRRTHDQARQAHRLATVDASHTERNVLAHDEPGLAAAALLAQDFESTRSWVHSTLGELVRDNEQAARLRDTLLTLLSHDMNYTATAAAMSMHKNSIVYRRSSAEALIGRTVAENRLNIHLALTVCAWLGPRMLLDSPPA